MGSGRLTILIFPTNSQRLPAVQTLDLNFDKSIRLGGARRVTLNAAMFNISNAQHTSALATDRSAEHSTANFLTSIVGPRVVRFGMRVNF